MKQVPENEKAVADAVTALYLETGKDVTAAEIAPKLGWTVAKVRAAIASAGGLPQGLTCAKDTRPSYSKDYPTMESGTHTVWVYGPSRETLRARLLVMPVIEAAATLVYHARCSNAHVRGGDTDRAFHESAMDLEEALIDAGHKSAITAAYDRLLARRLTPPGAATDLGVKPSP